MTNNKPLENPVLQDLFEKRQQAVNDQEEYAAIMTAIIQEAVEQAKFLSVIDVDEAFIEKHEDGTITFKEGGQITFRVLTGADGKTFYPAFTNWSALENNIWSNSTLQTLVLSFDDYWTLIQDKDAGMVIDPFTENIAFDKDTMRRFHEIKEMHANGSTRHTVDKDTPVQIGEPAEDPVELKNILSACAKTQEKIEAMWLKLMVRDGEKSFLLIVDAPNEKEIFDTLGKAAITHLGDMYLDMICYDTELGHAADGTDPFYRKEGTH